MELQYGKENFLDRVFRKGKSERSRDIARMSISRFENYCMSKFTRSGEEVIAKMKSNELDVYRVLDDFISCLDSQGVTASSIGIYISWVRSYLVYSDIDITPYKFKIKVNMPKKQIRRDAELTVEQVSRILHILPLDMRLVCMLVMTTLRRPNEIARLRVRDMDLNSTPVRIVIPASVSKNRVEGLTFTTAECAGLLSEHIKRNRLKPDDYLFSAAGMAHPVRALDNRFNYHLQKEPDLCDRQEGQKVRRYKIHIYSFKKFGYTRADRKFGKNFADGLKGDKNSEYHRLPLEERAEMYLELEPELTIFNAEAIRKRVALTMREINIMKEKMAGYDELERSRDAILNKFEVLKKEHDREMAVLKREISRTKRENLQDQVNALKPRKLDLEQVKECLSFLRENPNMLAESVAAAKAEIAHLDEELGL